MSCQQQHELFDLDPGCCQYDPLIGVADVATILDLLPSLPHNNNTSSTQSISSHLSVCYTIIRKMLLSCSSEKLSILLSILIPYLRALWF